MNVQQLIKKLETLPPLTDVFFVEVRGEVFKMTSIEECEVIQTATGKTVVACHRGILK